jgi:hypothetical protein
MTLLAIERSNFDPTETYAAPGLSRAGKKGWRGLIFFWRGADRSKSGPPKSHRARRRLVPFQSAQASSGRPGFMAQNATGQIRPVVRA